MPGRGKGRNARCGGGRARACAAVAVLVSGLLSMADGRAQVSVSSGGTPSLRIPIVVPPGIGGMAPNLGFAYTGGGVNGPAGYGWTLTGLSLITRCPGSTYLDGAPKAVTYTPADRLCLDGQRLIQTNAAGVPLASTPAANGALADANGLPDDGGVSYTEYRTEKDLYSRVRAYGSVNGAAANGPLYFRVWTKAGQIYEYGGGPASDPASTYAVTVPYGRSFGASWAVSRISDTAGNFIDFKYGVRNLGWGSNSTPGHEWNLAEIQYTGNGSQLANDKVVFDYEDRPDVVGGAQDRSEAYHAGTKNLGIQRLRAVRSYVNWPSSSLGVSMPTGAPVAPPASAVKVRTLKVGYQQGATTNRSTMVSVTECFGPTETSCLPATTFRYTASPTNEVYTANANFNGSSLATLQLRKADGSMGTLLGDFNGDGRTDILRWSNTPSQNQLWTSNGDGTFTQQTGFNLTAENLFRSDACYASTVMDFNGDGRQDILRVMQPTSKSGASCGTPVNLLYLSRGDGTFSAYVLPSSISLQQTTARLSSSLSCLGRVCGTWFSQTLGANYYVFDVNGDGFPDIVTTISPSYVNQLTQPTADSLCASQICTHVYLGTGAGVFNELTATNLARYSLYGPPTDPLGRPRPAQPFVVDQDGDGLMDLVLESATWRSLGNGNFQRTNTTSLACANPVDFNGDGRGDCLNLLQPASANSLGVADGTGAFPAATAFNLTGSAGNELNGAGVGFVVADLNADGRGDLLRWKDDPTQNAAYLSNGDGSFRKSTLFNLNNAAYALKKSDGSVDFQIADFTGNGNVEILRTVSTIAPNSAATTNQLFVKASNAPPDQLASMTSSTGLTSTLTYVPLPNSTSGPLGARYRSGPALGLAAVYPQVDLTLPLWVVATVETATGVGAATTKDEYAYGGLRASLDGRGLLGFLSVREQHTAPDGSPLTTETSYLQAEPVIGLAGVIRTFDGALDQPGAPLISRTTNAYCDTTWLLPATGLPAGGGASPMPCDSRALVRRPYLYQSLEEGWDIDPNRTALPTVKTTNQFNGSGDAVQVKVETTGMSAGLSQSVAKVTDNVFYPDDTAGNAWILGRLKSSTQTNSVPHLLPSLTTSAGTGAHASATTGVAP